MNARKAIVVMGALGALLAGGPLAVTAATTTAPVTDNAGSKGTAIDWAIDSAVSARNLSAADQKLLREQLQLQFLSLSASARQQVLASAQYGNTQDSAQRLVASLSGAVAQVARQAESAAAQADRASARANPQAAQQKLGVDGDLVYLATLGPCRIYDSRNGPGPLAPLTGRQIYTISITNGYSWAIDQGGTGSTGAGNCVPTAFAGVKPTAVVATVTATNTVAAGALQAWNGGTTLSGGAVVNWEAAGDRNTNTTIIPMDRSIAPYPGSGGKRDIAVFNNSGSPIDFVIDVVGYMIENQATPLDCTTIDGTIASLPDGTSNFFSPPACPAGYTQVASLPYAPVYGLWTGTVNMGGCRISNSSGAAQNVTCDARCCRVPGR
jgi:hypothetical protein